MKSRIVSIRQRDSNDCGVACLASIAAFHGLRIPLARLQQLSSTDRTGTNALGLVQAATALGLQAKGVRSTLESLLGEIPFPAIAHVVVDGRQHYVAVYKAGPRQIVYMDPQDGTVQRVTPETFAQTWSGVLILLAPGDHFERGDRTVSPARRFWQIIQPHRWVLFQVFVGAVLYTLIGLSTAIYLQKIVDYVFPSGNQNLLNLLSIAMIALLGTSVYLNVSQQLLLLGVARRVDGQLVLGYYTHLLSLPLRFFSTRRTGDTVSRVNDAVKIRQFVSSVLLRLTLNTLILVAAIGLMFLYSWKLALILLCALPLYAAVYVVSDRINKRNERALLEQSAELQSWLVESVDGISTIKSQRIEDYASVQTESRLVRLFRTLDRAERVNIGAQGAAEGLYRMATVTVLWAGGTMVLHQTITPGELLSLYALVVYLGGPAAALIGMNRDIYDARFATDRLFEVIDLPVEDQGGPAGGVSVAVHLGGDIVFDRVCFRYGAGPQVLRDFSLTIPRGRVTAIVGGSGSGKSTILSLLQKHERPDTGTIRIGDLDLAHIQTDSLRQHIGVVPQKVELFSGTIFGNIVLGDMSPDVRRALLLADQLGITEFVQQLPLKFDTPLGEHGTALSGGQRQRIAIARALYRNPEVLLLDEATSSLDTASERRIQHTLDESIGRGSRTTVLIAHRLSTVVNADHIVVLGDGGILEQGTHHELIAQRGVYYNLRAEQFPGEMLSMAAHVTRERSLL